MMQTPAATRPLAPSARPAIKVTAGLAAAALVVTIVVAPKLAWPALLMAGLYCLGIALGSTFFLALQSACYARWSRTVEPVARVVSSLLPWTLLILVPALTLGLSTLYEWTHAGHGGHHSNGFRNAWLSTGFFWVRAAAYLLAWIVFTRVLSSRPQTDAHAGEKRRVAVSAAFIVVFAVTFVPASLDWIMSIESHWFSTIFGVYNFAGMFLSALAFLALAVILAQKAGLPIARANQNQLHDLGRLIFAFSSFWAYLWFCQYMLIWYSNLPEETGYYLLRHAGIWRTVSFLNFICNWVVPFLLLMSSRAKRDATTLMGVCIVVLIGRALDLAFMILPPFGGSSLALAVGLLAAAGALLPFGLLLARKITRGVSAPAD